jgi:cysteine-S-conjugate beta-lyase
LHDFLSVHDRLAWSATKWMRYAGRDVIPLWIADMDFATALPIQEALTAHVTKGDLGYMTASSELAELLVKDHWLKYGWNIEAEWIVWLPGVVLGLNLAVKTCCDSTESVIVFSPSYPPFLQAPLHQERGLIDVPFLRCNSTGTEFAIDFFALERAVSTTSPATSINGTGEKPGPARLLLLCHPHNPIGRLFTYAELVQLAAFCERHDLYVCSDELHCDMILDEQLSHVPFACAAENTAPALLQRLITLHGPGKTYNIPGLGIAWAIIPNVELRSRFRASMQKLVPDPCCLGFTALSAALTNGEPWRLAMLKQLRINRDMVSLALDRMGLPHTHPEVSFLTWIDGRSLDAKPGGALGWFESHGVGLSDGADFGCPGFLRLNYATQPPVLSKALARMCHAMKSA